MKTPLTKALADATASPMVMRWAWLNRPGWTRWAATITFLALMNWLLLVPSKSFENVPVFLSYQDKIVHGMIFAALAGLIRWSIPGVWGKGWRRAVVIVALAAYGAGIECIQPLIPQAGRMFEWMDLLLDCVGIGVGVWTCERLARKGEPVDCPPAAPRAGCE